MYNMRLDRSCCSSVQKCHKNACARSAGAGIQHRPHLLVRPSADCSVPALDVLAQILSKRHKVEMRHPFLTRLVNEMQDKNGPVQSNSVTFQA